MQPRTTQQILRDSLIYLSFLMISFFPYALGVLPYHFDPKPKALPAASVKYDETIIGKASWYGIPFDGRLTANGERYNMHTLTAAHKTLPFNSVVKVTNLKNHKTIFVRINDRGPYVEGRNIDLSLEAAERLGMLAYGVAPVKLEVIKPQKGKSKTSAVATR